MNFPRPRFALPAVLAVVALACSSEHVATSTAGAGAATSSSTAASPSASSGSTSASSASTGGGGQASGCTEWPGWEDWDDFAPEEAFCVPSSVAALPAPIEWEACPPEAGMPTGCRRMKPTWRWKTTPFAYTGSAAVDAQGRVFIEFAINASAEVKPYGMRVVSEVDGPMRSAFLQIGTAQKGNLFYVGMDSAGVADGKSIFRVSTLGSQSIDEAIVGGEIDALHPTVLQSWSGATHHKGAKTSSQLWSAYTVGQMQLAQWGGSLSLVASGGGEYKQLTLHDDAALWVSGEQYNGSDILAYTPQKGAFTLVARPAGTRDMLSGLGTDGNHIVWTHSSGKIQPSDPYTARTFMVSPFAIDASSLTPVSLGNYPLDNPVVATPSSVGCGYAVHHYMPGKTRIIRLSDGHWWDLPSPTCTPPDFSSGWCPGNPLAVTCGEVFLTANENGLIYSFVRVEMSALGEPNPPQ